MAILSQSQEEINFIHNTMVKNTYNIPIQYYQINSPFVYIFVVLLAIICLISLYASIITMEVTYIYIFLATVIIETYMEKGQEIIFLSRALKYLKKDNLKYRFKHFQIFYLELLVVLVIFLVKIPSADLKNLVQINDLFLNWILITSIFSILNIIINNTGHLTFVFFAVAYGMSFIPLEFIDRMRFLLFIYGVLTVRLSFHFFYILKTKNLIREFTI